MWYCWLGCWCTFTASPPQSPEQACSLLRDRVYRLGPEEKKRYMQSGAIWRRVKLYWVYFLCKWQFCECLINFKSVKTKKWRRTWQSWCSFTCDLLPMQKLLSFGSTNSQLQRKPPGAQQGRISIWKQIFCNGFGRAQNGALNNDFLWFFGWHFAVLENTFSRHKIPHDCLLLSKLEHKCSCWQQFSLWDRLKGSQCRNVVLLFEPQTPRWNGSDQVSLNCRGLPFVSLYLSVPAPAGNFHFPLRKKSHFRSLF